MFGVMSVYVLVVVVVQDVWCGECVCAGGGGGGTGCLE